MKDRFIRELLIDWDQIPADSYLRRIPALRSLEKMTFSHAVTLFAGENGTGKSTLLEGMAEASGFNPEGGTKNFHFSTYDDVSELHSAMKLIRGTRRQRHGFFFRAESFFNVASVILNEYDDGNQPDYHAQSHGESFLNFIQEAGSDGLYLMDEPEAALSPQRQLTLLLHIVKMAEKGAQFIIATHSPILLGIPDAQILAFEETGIHPVSYEETESYKITKLFVENRERMLGYLLEEDSE